MQIPKYGLYELILTSQKSHSNYFNVTLSASFISPTGKTFIVNGFYDGNNTWKIRFVPNEVGIWNITTTSSDSNLSNKTDQIDCTSSNLSGLLQTDPINPYCLKYRDGSNIILIGDTGMNFVMDQTAKVPSIRWRDYFDEMSNSLKTNHVYNDMVTHPLWDYIYGRYSWPFGGTATAPDFSIFNLDQFRYIDTVIDYAETKGVVVSIILLDWITEPKGETNSLSSTQKQLYYKYCVARLGHHKNIIYNLYWDIAPDQQYVRDEANYIKSIDPYNHLLTSHQQRDTGCSYAAENWTDLISLETLDELDGNDIKVWRIYNKPVIITEDRYNWWRFPDYSPYFYRRLLWATILSGGIGATWGEADSAYPTYAESEAAQVNNPCLGLGGKRDFKHIYNLFLGGGIPFWDMIPHDDLVSPGNKCLAKTGSVFIVYLPNPDSGGIYTTNAGCPENGQDHNSVDSNKTNIPSVTVDLISFGSIEIYAKWYNPQTGLFVRSDTITGGSKINLTAPAQEDWIVIISNCKNTIGSFTIT